METYWRKYPEEKPRDAGDPNDWCSRSVKCLVRDDWNEIHLAKLQFMDEEWCLNESWRMDGPDDSVIIPRGPLYWIAIEDLLPEEVQDAKSN